MLEITFAFAEKPVKALTTYQHFAMAAALEQALTQHDKVRRSTDIPLFYGKKDKDAISPQQLVERLERAARVAGWATDERKCDEFFLCLREQAISWSNTLFNIPDFNRNDWAAVKREFLAAYAPKYTARTLCTSFHDLKQSSNENVQDFYNRVSEVFRDAFLVLPDHVVAHGGTAEERHDLTEAQARGIMKKGITNMLLLMMNTMFTGGLREEIRNKVLEKGLTKIQETVQLAREIEIIHKDKKEKSEKGQFVAAIGESDPVVAADDVEVLEVEADDVDSIKRINAIRQRMNKPPLRFKVRPGSRPKPPSGNPVICRFCKIRGHFQVNCRKRIAANAPMVDVAGKPIPMNGSPYTNSRPGVATVSSPYYGLLPQYYDPLNQ